MRRERRPHRGEHTQQYTYHPAMEVEAIVLDYMPRGYYADPHKEHRTSPVAQALGLRNFLLLDGTPLEPVEPLEYVTLAREIVRAIPVPTARTPTTRRIQLACMPGKDKHIYCYPYEVRDPPLMRLVVEAVEAEDPRVVVVTSLEALKSVARERGLPEKILVVPKTPITFKDLSDFARKTLEDALRKAIKDREEFFVEFFNIAEPINIRLHSLSTLKGVGKRTLIQILRRRERQPFKSFDEVKKIMKSDPVDSLVDKILEEIRGEARYYLFVRPPDPREPFLNYMEALRRRMRQKHALRPHEE